MKSLRSKMTVLVLLFGAPFLVAAVQGLLFVTEQNNAQERKSVARRAFNRLARDLEGANPQARVSSLYEQSGLESLGAGAALIDQEGKVLWESPSRSPLSTRRAAQQYVLDEGTLLGMMPERQPSSDLQMLVFSVAALGLTLYGTSAWWLVGSTLKPITKLVQRVSDARENPQVSIVAPSTDHELVNLVETLNRLIKDVRNEGQERVDSYATLSHELRTPIQALLLQLDLTLGRDQDKEELEYTLLDVQRQVYRLKHLSEAVLTLQGLSRTAVEKQSEPRNVKAIVDEIILELQAHMEVRHISILTEMPDSLFVVATTEHLALLVRNLLENAVKHSEAGSQILVRGLLTKTGPQVRVDNLASGSMHLAGNGLGLRICRELVRVNGWNLRVLQSEGQFTAIVDFGLVPG